MNAEKINASSSLALFPEQFDCSSITKDEVLQAQQAWGNAIISIGEVYLNNGDYQKIASEAVDRLYGYQQGKVLFKPSRAAEQQFRETAQQAKSYFVTGVVEEDRGFAIQPWKKIHFENHEILLMPHFAVAMGNYFLIDANTHEEVKAEYTFGYCKDKEDKLRIHLHHSSFPYVPSL